MSRLMLWEFALFLKRSPKNIVHLSMNSGEPMSASTLRARFDGFVSAANSSTSAPEGMRPVKSRLTRRLNARGRHSAEDVVVDKILTRSGARIDGIDRIG